MNVIYDKSPTLRSQTKHHEPIVLVYDARGNGGGTIAPTMTGDHNAHISDYTTIILTDENIHGKTVF